MLIRFGVTLFPLEDEKKIFPSYPLQKSYPDDIVLSNQTEVEIPKSSFGSSPLPFPVL